MKFVYDTNIFIYFLDGVFEVEQYFSQQFLETHEISTSRIVRIELLSYPGLSSAQITNIDKMLVPFELVPISESIEELTIYFRKNYKLKLPDAIIAATAYQNSATLVTNNTKDFKHISEIKIESPVRKK